MPGREKPTQEAIERRAYEIYIERGAVEGNHLSDWFAAEKELTARAEGIETAENPRTDLRENELRSTESRPTSLRKSVSAS
jgi:Protein of unknown function (DUF2934)